MTASITITAGAQSIQASLRSDLVRGLTCFFGSSAGGFAGVGTEADSIRAALPA